MSNCCYMEPFSTSVFQEFSLEIYCYYTKICTEAVLTPRRREASSRPHACLLVGASLTPTRGMG